MGRTTRLIAALLVYCILNGSPSSRVFAQSDEHTTDVPEVPTLPSDTTTSSSGPTTTDNSSTEKCNEYGFICTAGGYKLCIDAKPPSSELPCKQGTKCHMSCPVECSSHACEKCNKASYYCVDDKTFKICLDDREIPEEQEDTCSGDSVCSMNCNSASICTAQACPVTCTEDTRLPVPSDPASYYICSVDQIGQVTVNKYSCPNNTIFDPVLKKCTTKVVPTPTTPAPPFTCTSAGKFPDPDDCTFYFVCIAPENKEDGYTKTSYKCPPNSYFNPRNGRCTLDASVCSSVKATRDWTESECSSEIEKLEDPTSCSHYMLCHWFRGHLTPHSYECPDGSVFNPYTGRCTYRYDCNEGY